MASRPQWLKVKARVGPEFALVKAVLDENRLTTVCRQSGCPNIWECFAKRETTILILGAICARACLCCRLKAGRPAAVDETEPRRVAEAVKSLALRDLVVTAPARDDLVDGGAAHFARTVAAIRGRSPSCVIELLIPDFRGDWRALATVAAAGADAVGHNIETVARLFPEVKPKADYRLSLALLKRLAVAGLRPKSGLMVGLGESRAEIRQTLEDIAAAGVRSITIGQYLPPSANHWPVARYYRPAEFMGLAGYAKRLGFKRIISGPLVRSSYRGSIVTRSLEAACSSAPNSGGYP